MDPPPINKVREKVWARRGFISGLQGAGSVL